MTDFGDAEIIRTYRVDWGTEGVFVDDPYTADEFRIWDGAHGDTLIASATRSSSARSGQTRWAPEHVEACQVPSSWWRNRFASPEDLLATLARRMSRTASREAYAAMRTAAKRDGTRQPTRSPRVAVRFTPAVCRCGEEGECD